MSAFLLAPSLPLNSMWSAYSSAFLCVQCSTESTAPRTHRQWAEATLGQPLWQLPDPGVTSTYDRLCYKLEQSQCSSLTSQWILQIHVPEDQDVYENKLPYFKNTTWAAKPGKVNCIKSCYGRSRTFGKPCPKEGAEHTGMTAPSC